MTDRCLIQRNRGARSAKASPRHLGAVQICDKSIVIVDRENELGNRGEIRNRKRPARKKGHVAILHVGEDRGVVLDEGCVVTVANSRRAAQPHGDVIVIESSGVPLSGRRHGALEIPPLISNFDQGLALRKEMASREEPERRKPSHHSNHHSEKSDDSHLELPRECGCFEQDSPPFSAASEWKSTRITSATPRPRSATNSLTQGFDCTSSSNLGPAHFSKLRSCLGG